MSEPKLYDGVKHEADCLQHFPGAHIVQEFECGGEFECETCGKIVGNCQGAADDLPGDCTDCWAKKHPELIAEHD